MSKRVLIIEDDKAIARLLRDNLEYEGFVVETCEDGRNALASVKRFTPDLLLLDLMLPHGADGFDICRSLSESPTRVPVIILSARDDVRDKVAGLQLGADDYLTKPFELDELLARIQARLRDAGTSEPIVLSAGGVSLDLRTRRATVEGRTVELSAREFALLELFLRHPDQVLSREQLLAHVWGYDFDPNSNVVEVYVGYLRRKLGPEHIATVRGMGYRLVSRRA